MNFMAHKVDTGPSVDVKIPDTFGWEFIRDFMVGLSDLTGFDIFISGIGVLEGNIGCLEIELCQWAEMKKWLSAQDAEFEECLEEIDRDYFGSDSESVEAAREILKGIRSMSDKWDDYLSGEKDKCLVLYVSDDS